MGVFLHLEWLRLKLRQQKQFEKSDNQILKIWPYFHLK